VSSKAVGSSVPIELYRGGSKQTIELTVGERPGG
jgi:S1-C subfamily serine protease